MAWVQIPIKNFFAGHSRIPIIIDYDRTFLYIQFIKIHLPNFISFYLNNIFLKPNQYCSPPIITFNYLQSNHLDYGHTCLMTIPMIDMIKNQILVHLGRHHCVRASRRANDRERFTDGALSILSITS